MILDKAFFLNLGMKNIGYRFGSGAKIYLKENQNFRQISVVYGV